MVEENRSWHEDSAFREKLEEKKRKEEEEAKKLEEEKKISGAKPAAKQRKKSDRAKPSADKNAMKDLTPKTPGNYIREAYFHSFKSKRAGGENKVDDDKRMHSDKNIRGQMR